jgi:hypothetical protein
MLKVKIQTVFIFIFVYSLFGFSLIIAFSELNLNYSYEVNKIATNQYTKTISELIALDENNSLVYTIMITIYMILKALTIAIFMYDYKIFKTMNKEKHYKYGGTQVVLSYFNIVTIFIHMCGMIYIVFVKVTEYHGSHVVVAALTFGNAFISSLLLFIRRFLVHNVDDSILFISLNAIYLLLLIIVSVLFLFFLEGYIEWIFIYLLVLEHLFLAHDYEKSTISIGLTFVKDEYNLKTKLGR